MAHVRRRRTSVTLDPAHLELVRGYLAGETAFPDDALAVTATVATDFLSQNTCFVPSRVTDNPGIVYSLLTKGLYWRFVFGENIVADARDLLHRPRTGLDLSQRRERQVMETLRRDDANHRAQVLAAVRS